MAVITFPDTLDIEKFTWEIQRQDVTFSSIFGSQSVEGGSPLWKASITCPDIYEKESGDWQALIMKLKGRNNQLALHNLARPIPLGSFRGSPTLSSNVSQGANSLTMKENRTIPNLISFAEDFNSWTKTNCTVTTGFTDPYGNTNTRKIIRTLAADHHIDYTYTTTSHANNTYTYSVWLQRGTYTGGVKLAIKDGTGTVLANSTFVPNASLTRVAVKGTFGASPAANIIVSIDPTDDVGTAGDYFYVFGAQLVQDSVINDYAHNFVAGDFIGLGSGTTQQVVMITDTVYADGNENITVNFEPPLRNAFTAGSSIIWDKPKVLFRQTTSNNKWDYMSVFASGYSLDLQEDYRP